MFTDVPVGACDVLETGKRRNAADVLAIEGEKSATMLAAMVRTVWLYENRPEINWSGLEISAPARRVSDGLILSPAYPHSLCTRVPLAIPVSTTPMIRCSVACSFRTD